MIAVSGQTLALADITAVRRKSEYRPRLAGVAMFLCGLVLLVWGWRDETSQRQERQAKFLRAYTQAEQRVSTDSGVMDSIQPLDISQALQTDAKLMNWGTGLLGVGFVCALVRRRRHYVMVATGGPVRPIYRAKTLAQATQIVEEIAAKMG